MSGFKSKAKEIRAMKRLLKKLIEWMESNGISNSQILDCIKYILS